MNNSWEPNERQKEIIDAALELLNEKGYSELSLRDIAKKLGMQAPAIYWHFKNKAMLVNYMAEYIVHKKMGKFNPRGRDQSWQDWLIYHITLFREAMLSYPDGGRVVADAHLFPNGTLAKFMEESFASLRSAGMELRTARSVMLTVIRYTFGCVIEEQADEHNWETLPERAVDHGELTNVMEAISLGGSDDENFKMGLKLIVIGGSEVMASGKL